LDTPLLVCEPVLALRKLHQKYRDRPMSLADACIVRMAFLEQRVPENSNGWSNNLRALAGLRRAQTFLRALGVEITFSREGRAGSRTIRIQLVKIPSAPSASSVLPAVMSLEVSVLGQRINISRADDTDGADANPASILTYSPTP
jgi:hypothetical protein